MIFSNTSVLKYGPSFILSLFLREIKTLFEKVCCHFNSSKEWQTNSCYIVFVRCQLGSTARCTYTRRVKTNERAPRQDRKDLYPIVLGTSSCLYYTGQIWEHLSFLPFLFSLLWLAQHVECKNGPCWEKGEIETWLSSHALLAHSVDFSHLTLFSVGEDIIIMIKKDESILCCFAIPCVAKKADRAFCSFNAFTLSKNMLMLADSPEHIAPARLKEERRSPSGLWTLWKNRTVYYYSLCICCSFWICEHSSVERWDLLSIHCLTLLLW